MSGKIKNQGRKYRAVMIPADDDGYVVTYPELPGVVAHGETPKQAMRNAEELRMEWIEARKERGWWVPEPDEE